MTRSDVESPENFNDSTKSELPLPSYEDAVSKQGGIPKRESPPPEFHELQELHI